jgi:hypothetical protein
MNHINIFCKRKIIQIYTRGSHDPVLLILKRRFILLLFFLRSKYMYANVIVFVLTQNYDMTIPFSTNECPDVYWD